MTAEHAGRSDLDDAIAAIYGGSPDAFVSRREALAKQLRAEGRREDAAAVKRFRKPKRLAWALDAAAVDDIEAVDRVRAAVAGTLTVQSSGGDPRDAFGRLRQAVQMLADAAIQAAAQHGHSVEHGDLVQAVLAVIGVADAFDALRAGRLVDIPAAGALDLLTTIAASGITAEPAAPSGTAETPEPDATAVHEAARRADAAVAAARDRAAAAERALRLAEAKVEAAEEQVRRAQQELNARRTELERSQRQAHAAATRLHGAEQTAADARSKLERLQA